MVFLDTNAFYYVAKISTINTVCIEKLIEIIENNKTCISIITLYEFFTRFINKSSTLNMGITFLINKKIQIRANEYFSKKYTDLQQLLKDYKDDPAIVIKRILDERIEVESEFTAICFQSSTSLMNNLLNEVNPLSQDDYPRILAYYNNLMYITFKNNFKKLFKDGYSTNNCENIVRIEYNSMLEKNLRKTLPSILDKNNNMILQEKCDKNDTIMGNKKQNPKTVHNRIRLKAVKLRKEKGESYLNNILENQKSLIKNRINDSNIANYLYEIIKEFVEKGSSYRKNNIFDILILSDIAKGDVLITFDCGLIDRMKNNADFSSSIDIIHKLKI